MARQARLEEFNVLGLELFNLQFKSNSVYQKICEARKLTPQMVEHWTQIPAVPTTAFKELELTSFAPEERPAVSIQAAQRSRRPVVISFGVIAGVASYF